MNHQGWEERYAREERRLFLEAVAWVAGLTALVGVPALVAWLVTKL